MKKILVSMLAVAAMVACSTEHTVVAPANNDAIGFDTFVDKTTRAEDITTANIADFGVYASVTNSQEASALILTNEKVSKNDGAWSYVNTQYWVPGNSYNFTAIAPFEGRHWTYDTGNLAQNGVIAFDNATAEGEQDLVFAYAQRANVVAGAQDKVGLTFSHLLSKVAFKFTSGYAQSSNIAFEVYGIKINNAVAEAEVEVENGAVQEWAQVGGTTFVREFGKQAAEDVRLASAAAYATEHHYLLPIAKEYNITFNVDVYQAGVKVGTYPHTINTTINLAKGGNYNISATLNEKNTGATAFEAIEFEVLGVEEWEQVVVAEANSASDIQRIINDDTVQEAHIVLTGDINLNDLLTRAAGDAATITVPNGKVVTIDLNGFTLTATDTTTKNYSAIDNRGTLVVKNGTIIVEATENSGWSRYSAVLANNPGGNLTVEDVTLEHLGGTDMAYGIDNLTNGKGTYAVTTIKNSTVKSIYRAVRQFLNGVEATNEMYVEAGTILEGANKSIFFHDPSNKANTGKLVVAEGAQLKGDVYLFVTAGSPEWPVEVSIASSALVDGSKVTSGNVPAGYDVVEKDGNYVVEYGVEVNGNEIAVRNAGGLKWIAQQVNSGADYFAGKTVKLVADIDLKGEEWTPIGSAYKDHGFMGNFDGNGYTIKNLTIKNITPDSDGYVYAGLFGVTEGTDKDNQNYIKNLVIENVDIDLNGHIVAAAIAYPYYTKIENVTVQGNISIKGGHYTAGVLAYTRYCVDATNIAIEANNGSIEGNKTVGGVISDIQMNGGLTANYSNFSASNLSITATQNVGGISGIICLQTLDGATVKNVTIVCNDARKGIVAGADGGKYTLENVVYENVTGATDIVGAPYDGSSN